MSPSFFTRSLAQLVLASGLGASATVICEKDQAQRASKNENISNVKHEGVIDTAARHVQEIKDIAVNQTVQNIGQRTANQQTCANAG